MSKRKICVYMQGDDLRSSESGCLWARILSSPQRGMNNSVITLTAGNMCNLQLPLVFNFTYMLHAPLRMHGSFCN